MPLMKSWIQSANTQGADFPLNNLPYGVFCAGQGHRLGVAIGDFVLDVARVDHGLDPALFVEPTWNAVMAAGRDTWDALRARLMDLLGNPDHRAVVEPHLLPLAEVKLEMPVTISEYTDFYAGRHHAYNVGCMFRGPENALPPNWFHMPIGYNGRASSVVVSGTPIQRPNGQLKGPQDALPHLGPSARFDLELELGALVGQPSTGPLTLQEAYDNIFGYVLLNDWSARDIQAWEYQPLGPFQAKATATTISPWIVTAAALEPFRCDTPEREVPLLPHLKDQGPMAYDIDLAIDLAPAGQPATTIARTNARELYFSAAQQLAHHASSGCPMRVGDLLGSGTISGAGKDERGSLLELSWSGEEPITLNGGQTRSFIEDGDTLTLRGHAQGDGYRIGFGTCEGQVLPARPL